MYFDHFQPIDFIYQKSLKKPGDGPRHGRFFGHTGLISF
jgi:hypothetical protein